MAQYKYSPSTNSYWTTGPAGTPIQVPLEQVPADIRKASEKRFGARAAAPAAAVSGAGEIPAAWGKRTSSMPPAGAPVPPSVPTTPPPPQSFLQRLQTSLKDPTSPTSPENLALGTWSPSAPPEWRQGTPEERYEKRVGQLPGPAQYVVPGTQGELSATTARTLGLKYAPETKGVSLLLPAAAGAYTGFMEPGTGPGSPAYIGPGSWPRYKRAGIEAGKEVLGHAAAKALTGVVSKGAELVGRYTAVPEMLARTTARIGQGVEDLFNRFPLKKGSLRTIDDITEQVSNGRLKDAAGQSIDQLRDEIESKVPKYTPGQAAPLQLHGPSGVPAKGVKFTLPDVDVANNSIVMRDFNSVEDAFNHLKKMSHTGFGKAGPKSGADSWLYREAAHTGRDILKGDLNDLGKPFGRQWGDEFAARNADYGTSVILEKNFKGTTRTARIGGESTGVIDQEGLRKKFAKEMPELRRLHPNDKPDAFQRAIAPTLGGATSEAFSEHPGGGLWERLVNLIGAPYMPETREVMPPVSRALTSPAFRRGAPAVLTTPLVAATRELEGALTGQDTSK